MLKNEVGQHNIFFNFYTKLAESSFLSFSCRIRQCLFFIYSFFQEKTLGDISFKLEIKIMNFMSVFFEKNIIKPTQMLSIGSILHVKSLELIILRNISMKLDPGVIS
jgi:hypothetical protein